MLAEFDQYLRPKLADAVDAGLNKVVIDVHSIRSLHTSALKLLMQSTQACRELGMSYALVGNAQIAVECKSLEETKFWTLHETIEAAKSQLGGTSSSTAPAQLVGA